MYYDVLCIQILFKWWSGTVFVSRDLETTAHELRLPKHSGRRRCASVTLPLPPRNSFTSHEYTFQAMQHPESRSKHFSRLPDISATRRSILRLRTEPSERVAVLLYPHNLFQTRATRQCLAPWTSTAAFLAFEAEDAIVNAAELCAPVLSTHGA
jgi:hypothetical protein